MPHECTTCGRQFDDGSKEMLSGCPNCGGNKFQFQPPGRDTAAASPASSDAEPADAEPADTDPTNTDPADAGSTDPEPAASGPAASESPAPEPANADPVDAAHTDPADAERDDLDTESTVDDVPSAGGERNTTDGQSTDRLADSEADAEIDAEVGTENRAQSDARSSSASADEIDEARRTTTETEPSEAGSPRGTTQGPPTEPPSDDTADEFDISGAVGPDDDEPVEKQPVAGSAPEHEEPASDGDTDIGALREELNDQFESIKITAPGQYELNLMELYDRKEYIISLQEDGRYVIEMADDYGIDD